MIYLLILIAFVISIIFSMLIIPRILIVALTKRLFDIPDERKIHTGAVPRLGGISFAPIILFTLAFISATLTWDTCKVCRSLLISFHMSHLIFTCSHAD